MIANILCHFEMPLPEIAGELKGTNFYALTLQMKAALMSNLFKFIDIF